MDLAGEIYIWKLLRHFYLLNNEACVVGAGELRYGVTAAPAKVEI